MTRRVVFLVSLFLGLSGLGACAAIDPYERPGVWTPIGASEANLRAMVANPDDLVRGSEEPGEVGKPAADAVANWRAGRLPPLPPSDTGMGGQPSAGGGSNTPNFGSMPGGADMGSAVGGMPAGGGGGGY